ncbi:hypothetical protein R3P38DRAFT_2637208 [Favolaschia claudopus]|uniref:Ubiquitin-like protease family profile domain-containing protein n=1 Tax=Favolaschia claudopus TaxID=2862362 RepID=A0AAW0ARR4_9AGAR
MGKQRSDTSADNPPQRGRKKFQFVRRGKAAFNAAVKNVMRPRSPSLPPDVPGPEAPGGLPLSGEEAHEALLAGEQYGVASERIEAHQAPVMLQGINYTAQGYKLVDIINTEDLPQWFHEQFEITADNLAVVKIWQKGEHEEVDQSRLWLLMFSRFLRLQIMDRARRFGARATAIQRDLVGQFLLPSSSGASVQLPDHRIPTQKQVRVMVSTSKHRTRLARNPFRATWLMVKRNRRDMYYYNPHDFEAPDHKSKFTVAITDNFSLDSTILNTEAPNGTLFMDSTHRLHNENRAATTVLCTANEGKHVMPGAYLISANIQATTIKNWFVETIRKIEARAQEVAADKSRIHHRDPAATNRLYARCQHIAANGKFDFTNINIDKSRSEYNGIVEALLELGITNYYIRLCQFHVIFAILRFDFDNGDQGLGFTIPVTMKAQILILFRALQRCRSMDQWEDAKRTFHAGLVDLLGETDQDTLTKAAAAERIATLHLEEEEEESSSSEDESPQPKAKARSKRVPQPNTKKAKNAGKPVLQVVQEYFDQNWFVEPWIKLFTDIGMPPGQSRDDTWNTNNWAETAFKQFNAVFLDNKHNKRIDQLASIILNHHLPYFRFFPTPDRGPSKAFLQLNHDANKLWETEMVTPSTVPDMFTVRRVEKDGPVQHTVVLMPLSCTCSDYKYTGKACVDIVAARIYRKAGPNSNWKGTYGYSPRFIKKRGPAKRVRIHRNSLLYFSDRRDLARRAARAERLRRLYVPHPSSPLSVPPPPPPPLSAPPPLSLPPIAPRDSDRFLNAEDASITTLQNTALWFHPRYKLRLDEMGVFVTLMNSCAIAVERGIIFLAGPPELGFRRHLHAIDWMQPLSVQQLRQANAHMLADLVESRHQQTVNRIVYFECRADHWTMFHHALKTDPPMLTWHNSLSIPEDNSLLLDIRDQRLLHQFFLPNRPKALPAALGPRYGVPTYHGLQKDDFTCGFWAVLIGFSALLDFDPCGIVIGAHYLKTLLRPLYSSFLRDETGVVTSLLRDTFRVFKPRVDLQHLPATSVICPRPHQYERAAPASSLRDPATIWTLLLPEAHDVALDPRYSDLLARIDAGDEHWHIVGDISIPPSRLKMLIGPEWTSEFVIDGYLELLIQDLSDDLVDPKVKRNPRGIPPPARSNPRLGQRKRWFEDVNIFDLELMIAPIFWRNHWLLAVVFFKEKRIRIYDSWTTRSAQRGSAVYGRLYEVLLWEHKQLFGGESLPADWEGADTAMTTVIPRQVNTYDCGIYTLAFAQAMVQGVDPALMVFTPTSAARGRKVIANRLCRAIHDDARNAAALGIQVEEAPQTPVGHVVFFQNPNRSNQWLPAKTISLTEEHATMEWMCELLWLEENERPCGQFVCLTEDWTQSARKIYEARDLAEIQWPASMLGHARYPSYASPSGRLLILALTAYKGMLVDQFLSRQPESTLFAQIKGDYVNRGPPRMTELSSGRAVEVSFELVLFPSFSLWRVPPHERLIFDLTNEIVEEVIDGVEGEDNRKALTHETEAIAAVSLCVAYVSRLTEQSEENVYAALKEGRVEWAKTDSEELRDIYGEACGGWLEVEQLKIAVPNLPPPIPIIIP